MKRFILLILIVIFITTLGVFFLHKPSKTESNKRISVVTSFYPLYYFASEIGRQNVQVYNLTPVGAEPHDYELTTQDIQKIESSDILILNGGGLESWGQKEKANLLGKKTVYVEAAATSINDKNDPHVWLDPILAQKEVEIILSAFTTKDPHNKPVYESNAKKLITRLEELDKEFKRRLSSCKQKNIVTSHAAFGYIASRYGLTQVPIAGLTPDEEPSAQKIAEISEFVKENQVKYIFFESLVSPKLSETLAHETGAQVISFNPLEGLTHEEEKMNKDYFTLQRDNLENLSKALSCL